MIQAERSQPATNLPSLLSRCPTAIGTQNFKHSKIDLETQQPGIFAGGASTSPGDVGLILVDSKFHIYDHDAGVCAMLGYREGELIGKSITILMSPVVARLHDSIFRRLEHISEAERAEVSKNLLLLSHSKCSAYSVMGADRKARMCIVSVHLATNNLSQIVLRISPEAMTSVPVGFQKFIGRRPSIDVQHYDGVTCIMMDIAGSTAFADLHSPEVMAELFHKVFVIAERVVLEEAFPFAYIHEVVGDSLLLLVNAGFMVRHTAEVAAETVAFHVALQVQRQVDVMLKEYSGAMYMRVGICSGAVCAGFVDERSLRVFGSTVQTAQLLESLCPPASIVADPVFYTAFKQQLFALGFLVVLERSELKGIGDIDIAIISSTLSSGGAHASLISSLPISARPSTYVETQ